MNTFLWMVLLAVVAVASTGFGYIARRAIAGKRAGDVEAKLKQSLLAAKEKEQEILLKAKEKALQVIDGAKKEEEERRHNLERLQQRLEERESFFDKRLLDFETKQQELQDRLKKLEEAKEKIRELHKQQMEKLEKIAGLTQEEAKQALLNNLELRSSEELAQRVAKLQERNSEEWEQEAKKILITVIERCASSHAVETTTTTVQLTSDEMKGRIIGREGRNIKTIEQLTGVEIIVDDTPETIVISAFSPIRRHLAKRVLDKLLADGRIHPARIEDTVEIAKQELAKDIAKAGLDAAREAGVVGLDPKLLKIMGRLKYRTSFGQNVLRHSIEVAHLSAMLAEELGADPVVARKGGFLHDIGKAVDHEVQGTHPEIGRDICKKLGLSDAVIIPIAEHHNDRPSSLEGIIVKSADAISGAREGARKDTYEDYIQRLSELEDLAQGFTGVEKCYAIQAGREIRVFVRPEQVDDFTATKLARDIANEIEQTLRYPGEIKVTLIREKRVIEYAR